MNASKVIVDGKTIVDLTGDSATPETVAEGETFHDASGEPRVGTMTTAPVVQETGNSETAVMSQKAVTEAIVNNAETVQRLADEAAASATNAANSEESARQSKDEAQTAATVAANAAERAEAADEAADQSAQNAAQSWASAENAKTAAEGARDTATQKATAATNAAQTATSKATEATNAANAAEAAAASAEAADATAEQSAEAAASAKAGAEAAKTAAEGARDTATQKAAEATNAAQTATSKATEASNSANAAQTAKTAAETAKNEAQAIKTEVETKLANGDYNGKDGKSAYQYAKDGGYAGTEAEFNSLLANATDKNKLSLCIGSDGLIYIYVDGDPVGDGVPQGQNSDVFGYVDESNTVVLTGNLADGTYTIKYEAVDASGNPKVINIGNMVLDTNVYYSITSNLTNCANSNTEKTVAGGSSYTATITANSGYELKSVTVTMGGSAVSVTNGMFTIASVTGDIVITAVAEKVDTVTNFADPNDQNWKPNTRLKSSYAEEALDGYLTTNYIAVKSGDVVQVTGMKLLGHSYIALAQYNNGAAVNALNSSANKDQFSESGGVTTFTAKSSSPWVASYTHIRLVGTLTGAASAVVINIKRNGEWL